MSKSQLLGSGSIIMAKMSDRNVTRVEVERIRQVDTAWFLNFVTRSVSRVSSASGLKASARISTCQDLKQWISAARAISEDSSSRRKSFWRWGCRDFDQVDLSVKGDDCTTD